VLDHSDAEQFSGTKEDLSTGLLGMGCLNCQMFQGDEHTLNLGLQRNGSRSGPINDHGSGPYWSKWSLT
jgi:hypothetical protein